MTGSLVDLSDPTVRLPGLILVNTNLLVERALAPFFGAASVKGQRQQDRNRQAKRAADFFQRRVFLAIGD